MSIIEQLNARLAIKKQAGMSALDRVAIAAATQASMEYEVFKGLGKGSGRGRPKGSKNGTYQSGPKANKPVESSTDYVAPKPNINNDSGEGHSSEDVHEAFNKTREHFGGNSFTPNVSMHSSKANAELHEAAMHSHLQDSGFKQGTIHNENNIVSTEYSHPNGNKVLLNAGSAGSRNFVGYHHETPEGRAADFGSKPKEAETPKATNIMSDLNSLKEKHSGFIGNDDSGVGLISNNTANADIYKKHIHEALTSKGYSKGKEAIDLNGGVSSKYDKAGSPTIETHHAILRGRHHITVAQTSAPLAAPVATPASPKALPAAAKQRSASAVGADGSVDTAKFKKGLSKIAGMTDVNDHNNALAHGAKLIGRPDIAAKAKAIDKEHMRLGHMPSHLSSQRSALHDDLAAHAKKVLSPEQAHALHMSY